MAGYFGSYFAGMQQPRPGQPGSSSFVGPMPQQSGGQKAMGALGKYHSGGGQGIPGLSAISQGLAKHQELKNQGRLLHTQTQLQQRASKAAQRGTIGTQTTMTGASGVKMEGSTLDLINQTNLEFELDQAIMQHSYELQRDAMDRAGDAARMQGFMQGGMQFAKMGAGGA